MEALVDRTHARDGGFILLTGEPGIGKTRLLAEVADYAHRRRLAMLSATCQEVRRSEPYAPWIDVIQQFVASSPPRTVHDAVAPRLPALTAILPELSEKFWLFSPEPVGSEALEPARLLSEIARFLCEVAAKAPLLITIDDVALADAASSDLLESIVRIGSGHPIALIAASRDVHLEENLALQQVLQRLELDHLATTVTIGRLDGQQVGELAATGLGGVTPSPRLQELLYRKSGGNPFFLEEILRALVEGGLLPPGAADLPQGSGEALAIPGSIASGIRQRLGHFDEAGLNVLRTASVLGVVFSVPVLSSVCGAREKDLLRALETAQKSGLVQEVAPGLGPVSLAFGHPLIQEVLYRDISRPRAQRIHLKVGRVLERLRDSGEGVAAAAIAYHYFHGNELRKALDYSVRAADEAAKMFARSEASEHCRRALSILEIRPDPKTKARVQERLGDQTASLGDAPAAARLYVEAAEGLVTLGRTADAGDCLRKAASCEPGPNAATYALLARARVLLETEGASARMVHWFSLHARMLYRDARIPEAERESRHGLDLAEQLGTPSEQATCRLQLAFSIPAEAREDCRRLLEEALAIARTHGLDELRCDVLAQRSLYTIQCGEPLPEVLGYLDEALAAATRAGSVERLMWLRGVGHPYLLLRQGHVDDALEAARAGGEFRSRHTGNPGIEATAYLGWIAVIQGDDERAESYLDESVRLLADRASWYWDVGLRVVEARLRLRQGRFPEAEKSLLRSLELTRQSGPTALHALWHIETLSLLVRSSLAGGNFTEAGRHLDVLQTFVRRFGIELGWAFAWRAEAQCLTAGGTERAESVRLLEKSRSVFEKLDWGYELASTLAQLGDLYGRRGEREKAGAANRTALRMFTEMSAAPEIAGLEARTRG
ncbi:MAG: AAA family ATPase [Thermoplasmata archaeon]|nr:AAA family ATPase [Thermoplasmata archaeon]